MLSLQSTLVKAGAALLLGLGAFLFSAFALRPYAPFLMPLGLTSAEWVLAAGVGVLVCAVAVWRLARGASAKSEVSAFLDAADGDHLG